jgi:hypothetical protein
MLRVNSKRNKKNANQLRKDIENNSLLEKQKKITKKSLLVLFIILALATSGILAAFWWATNSAFTEGQMTTWNMISSTEKNLRALYSNSIQTELKAWLPNDQMNFTDGLVWESKLLNYTQNRPKYQNVTQVLNDGKGACGEFVWVFGAFCVANDIPFRVIGVGYFIPNVVDHDWVQVNPSHDGKTWIHVEVTDTCDRLKKGETIDELWNVTIDNNSYYANRHYKMVLAYELNQNGEIVITDVTATFS